jgi:hypothetical protein
MHTAPTFPHPTGAQYTTFQELQEAHPDVEAQFKHYAESIGFPPGAWEDKLWSQVALSFANGRPIRDIATNIAFNQHGEQPSPDLLKKVHPHVQNRVSFFNKPESRVWFRSMLGCEWWIHGDYILSDTPVGVLAWAAASQADQQVAMGNDPTEMLGGFAVPKQRGRPPIAEAVKVAQVEKKATYAAYVAHCISLRTQRAALQETYHNQTSQLKVDHRDALEALQHQQKAQLADLKNRFEAEMGALAAPTFVAYKG